MRLHKKILFIKKCISCDTQYLEFSHNFGYTIEDYISVTSDLVTDDLKWKMELFSKRGCIINDWFTKYSDEFLDNDYILAEYAKFLIYMHYQVVKNNFPDINGIRNLHIEKYNLNSQRNFWNMRRKFYLA